MIKSIVAISKEENSLQAGKDAAEEAVDLLGSPADLFLVFASSFHDQEKVLQGVNRFAGKGVVVGCSSAGEIVSVEEKIYKGAVAVMAVHMEGVKVFTEKVDGVNKDSYSAGKKLAQKIAKKKPSLLMLFSDGFTENGAALVKGVQDVCGKEFPIIGGSAGDDFNFKKTYQYYRGKVFSGSVVGVAFQGDFSFGMSAKHGWEPVSLPMTVTKSEGPLIKEIDGKPAFSLYEEYFQQHSEEMAQGILAKTIYTYPLGMVTEKGFLLRELLMTSEKGEITLMADIPEGSKVRLMIGNRNNIISAAKTAAKEAVRSMQPKAVIMFNCIGRSKILGLDREKELEAVREVVGKKTPIIGFYTYGEIGPFEKRDDHSVFHNETINLLALGD